MIAATHPRVPMNTLFAEGRLGLNERLVAAPSGGRASPLRIGAATGALFGCTDDWVVGDIPPYGSRVLTIEHARVLSSAGIVVLPSGELLEDTFDHTHPELDGYRHAPEGRIAIEGAPARLPGRYLSLLLGAYDNHYHLLLMNFARLAILADDERRDLDGILVPADLPEAGLTLLARAAVARWAPLRPVHRREWIECDTLVLPWNVASDRGINRDASDFVHALGGAPRGAGARRIYVDRRGASRRVLANEADVVSELTRFGVEPVRFEGLSLAEQIAVMREAELVVGAHGAGLANIVFAAAGVPIVELRPPTGANWCYRYLAAARGQEYDCVWGRMASSSDGRWMVSPAHVASAVDAALADQPRRTT